MSAICARCQASLEPGMLEGLCPRCLLVQALPLEQVATTPPGAGFTPPAIAELAPLFPHLEIVALLGQGGMGAVYKARQIKLDRLVALKILPPTVAADPGFAERFSREARTLARLNHPHIVAVHDFGDVGGLYYLVMEFVEGVNLRQALANGRLDASQALAVVGELCAALQYAHEMGVVHRDIKPENVLLDKQGRVKVADFGLAKLVGPAQVTRLTATQQAMGTPHYMAPEQWERPLEVDHRADIYSLGVVFYELLTGELPLGKFAPPSQAAGVNARIDEVVLRAMERQPDARYQQMSEMKSAVESASNGSPSEEDASEGETLHPSFESGITTMMVAGVVAAGAGLAYAQPYMPPGDAYGWLVVALLALWWGLSYTNRYLARLWGLTAVALGLSSLVCYLWSLPHPLGIGAGFWVLVFLFVFLPTGISRVSDSFKENINEDDEEAAADLMEDEDEAMKLPVAGLSEKEEAIRQVLLAAADDDFESELHVLPAIDSTLLGTARRQCKVDLEDRVLGVMYYMDGEANLVFGCQTLYYRNANTTPYPSIGVLSYADLIGRKIVNHGDAIYLGNEQFLCPDPEQSGIDTEKLAELLIQVKQTLALK